MNHKYFTNYAKLPVHIGVRVQEGQDVILMSSVEAVDLARIVVKECYKAGANSVIVHYNDEINTHSTVTMASEEALANPPSYLMDAFEAYASKDAAFISIASSDPSLMEDVDPQRLKTFTAAAQEVRQPFMTYIMNGHISWNVLAYPNIAWAKKVFPDKKDNDALEALWSQIFTITRADQPDPIAAWQSHIDTVVRHREALNRHAFDALQFIGPGTDLEVSLPKGHLWKGAGHVRDNGRIYMANIPTEEVFTLPDKYRVNGYISSTKPLSHNGHIIDGFKLTVKDGKIIDYTAKKGEKALEDMISVDPGARYFGEVAIVPDDSPISNSGLTFFNSLYDENAACHLAIGSAYPHTIQGGEAMNDEEKDNHGVNTSITHVDFMVGSKEVDIFGVKNDGSKVPIIKGGNWTEDLHRS